MEYSKPKRDFWISKEGICILSQLSRNGFSQAGIAKFVGVTPATLCKWLKKYPNLRAAFNYSRDMADLAVEDALFRAAIGGEYEEETLSRDGIPVRIKRVAKPDPKALTLWLTNRAKNRWSTHAEPAISVDEKTASTNELILEALKARPLGNENLSPGNIDKP